MKILFDPIYSTQPQQCSSASKFKKIAERMLKVRDDVYIYWMIPDWTDDSSKEWLPSSERILYIPTPCSKDRVKEYQILPDYLDNIVAFNGTKWDYDILITMRTQQVPNFKVIMQSPRNFNMQWMKRLLCMEEMAVFGFRKTVPVSAPNVQDMMTAAGYLASDKSYITVQHVKDGILRAARTHFSPSKVKELNEKLALVNPSVLEGYEDKPSENRFKRGEQPFCLGFVGRMSNSMTRLDRIYKIMENNWVLKGDKGFKVIISTVSTGIKMAPPDFVQLENNPRDVFWKRLKEDMHLVISQSIDAEFSMSLIEPIMFGTPVVLAKEDWTEALFGKNYPFLAKNEAEAAGYVKAFHDDYEAMYKVFMDWRESSFRPRFEESGLYALNLYDDLESQMLGWEKEMLRKYREDHPGKENNSMVQALVKVMPGKGEFNIHDLISKSELTDLAVKKDMPRSDSLGIVWRTPLNELRLILKAFFKCEDAGVTVGQMRRVK